MKKLIMTSALFLTMAQANVSINTASFQEQTTVNASGEQVVEWVKASKVIPGTIIRYVNSLENSGSQLATKLVVNNPIPKNMEYILNSATCQSACNISYSVDDGKTFKEASNLFVGVGKARHLAKASEYTNIKWILNSLEATAQSAVAYKARLK